jgi:hypothetical protein
VRNVKGILDRLIEKLAVERVIEPNSFARTAATYRIYSYRTILERRKSAGLEWVTRANGVKFISTQLANEILSRPKFAEQDDQPPLDPASNVSRSTDRATTDGRTTDRLAMDGPSMDVRSSVPLELGPGLRKINPAFDSAAVARLWRECRARVTDCTAEEVLYFAGLKAAKLLADHNIRNTIGLMLTSVPEFFDFHIIHEFRDLKLKQAMEETRIADENEHYWRCILEDPTSTEEDREMAIKVIGS